MAKRGRKSLPKTFDELWEKYESEYAKVQTRYRQFQEKYQPKLTRQQLLNELKATSTTYNEKTGKFKSIAAVSFIQRQIRYGYTWTRKQIDAQMANVNEYIRKAWIIGAGRTTTKGRRSKDFVLNINADNLDDVSRAVLEVMVSYKGESEALTTYYITEADVTENSDYYKRIKGALYENGVYNDEVYGS